ncbi:MAG: glycoside hydrolase family 65 protein, partial [Alphaproteobacteria bacterium]
MSTGSTGDWVLSYDDFQPDQEGLREALCALGNGFFATRGAAEEAHADDAHYPGTYIAGVCNRLETAIAGRTVTNEDLVNCPNWLPMTFRIDDEDRWFNLRAVEILDYRQELDMRKGVLVRRVVFSDAPGRRFHLTSARLVHREQPHLAAIRLSITPEDWSGRITVRSGLDGTIINSGVARYRELNGTHLELIDTSEPAPDTVVVRVRTSQSR